MDFSLLKETYEIECKAAQGRDGLGEIPKDMWESYSALANTDGGSIFLGVEEKKGKFTPLGIQNVDKLIQELINTANSHEKVSVNLIDNQSIVTHSIEGKKIVEVKIRRATREERPVFLKKNPLGNTFRRRHEADQRMKDEQVKRLLADQQPHSLDRRILKGFSIEDLNIESFRAFKQACTTRSPESHFDTLSDHDFLVKVRGWAKDRETGESGLTVAALLMFGRYESITEEFPNYFVDYQERPESRTEQRYIDRVCPDPSWSGNLYDFYRRVYPKLVQDLKLGFSLKDGVREGESGAHVAVREALVNTLVHADYTVPTATLIVKRPDLFGFKNPGDLRIPLEAAYAGGDSDSRNKIIQDMFRMIGAGERQGFGIRKIRENWKAFDWKVPHFEVIDEVSPRVILTLSMLSLFPEEAVKYFKQSLPNIWEGLSENQKVALVVAYTEGAVTHNRLSQLCDAHPRDISDVLLSLEKSEHKLLASTGSYRSKTYHLPELPSPSPEDVFGAVEHYHSSPSNAISSPNKEVSSPNSETSSPNSDEFGRILHSEFSYPFVENVHALQDTFLESLKSMAELPRTKQRIKPDDMQKIILELCTEQYVTLEALGQILNREMETLRSQYITQLKNENKLRMAFPRTPNDPRQAYITVQ